MAFADFQKLPESVKAQFGQVWICPKCNGETLVGGEHQVIWYGKNLKCNQCGEFSYYREFIVKDG